MVVSVWARLNTRREVWRPSMVSDGMGGLPREFARVGVVRCKVDLPSAKEREQAGKWGAEMSHVVFLLPTADVRRGDELRGGGPTLRVIAVYGPSGPRYLKALCGAEQTEG